MFSKKLLIHVFSHCSKSPKLMFMTCNYYLGLVSHCRWKWVKVVYGSLSNCSSHPSPQIPAHKKTINLKFEWTLWQEIFFQGNVHHTLRVLVNNSWHYSSIVKFVEKKINLPFLGCFKVQNQVLKCTYTRTRDIKIKHNPNSLECV